VQTYFTCNLDEHVIEGDLEQQDEKCPLIQTEEEPIAQPKKNASKKRKS